MNGTIIISTITVVIKFTLTIITMKIMEHQFTLYFFSPIQNSTDLGLPREVSYMYSLLYVFGPHLSIV